MEQRVITPQTKRRFPLFNMIHEGIWREIYSYLPVNEIIKLRVICVKWRKYVHKYFEFHLLQNNKYLKTLQIINRETYESFTKDQKDFIQEALTKKSNYEKSLKRINKKYGPYKKLSDIAFLIKPPSEIILATTAILQLTMTKSELEMIKKEINWEYCRKKLRDRNLMKIF